MRSVGKAAQLPLAGARSGRATPVECADPAFSERFLRGIGAIDVITDGVVEVLRNARTPIFSALPVAAQPRIAPESLSGFVRVSQLAAGRACWTVPPICLMTAPMKLLPHCIAADVRRYRCSSPKFHKVLCQFGTRHRYCCHPARQWCWMPAAALRNTRPATQQFFRANSLSIAPVPRCWRLATSRPVRWRRGNPPPVRRPDGQQGIAGRR